MANNFEENLEKLPMAIKEQLIKKGLENPEVEPCGDPGSGKLRIGAPCQFRIDDKDGNPIGLIGFSYEVLADKTFQEIKAVLSDLEIFTPPKEQIMVMNGYDLRLVERSWTL